MNRVTSIRLIAGREITERLRGRATWILTGITTLVAMVLIVGPAVFRPPTRPTVVGLVGTSAQFIAPVLQATAKAAGVDITTMNVASDSAARSELAPSQSGGRSSRALGQLLWSLQGGRPPLMCP